MKNGDVNKSLTSTNKWKYVPGKVYTLTPLNLQDIRKQLLDTSNEESEDSEEDSEQEREENEISEILNESFYAGSPRSNDFPVEMQTERSYEHQHSNFTNHTEKPDHNHKHSSFSTSLETVPEDSLIDGVVSTPNNASSRHDNKENISSNVEPLNLSTDKKKNISFDLDFSALSLQTPVKKVEKTFNYVTPKINIIPPSESKSKMKSISLFKTPNVSSNQYLSRPLFKTPVNKPALPALYSGKKHHSTPYSLIKKPVLSSPQNMPSRRASGVSESQNAKPVMYTGQDGFNRMLVNDIEYLVMNILGKGGSSEVFYGFNSEEKLHVAIKLVSLSDPSTAEGYINEVKLLESLQTCDRIIKMYDYEIRDEKLIVVLEKGGEDLSAILKQLSTKQSHLPTYMLLFYWMEMLYAVRQIHANGVIHSDLKPANFLRAEGGLKLIDFGIACKVQEDMTCVYKSNQEGSCNYISPEALNLQTSGNVDSPNYGKLKYKVHYKSDVWSLGCILYQLVYRKTPFQHINQIWAKLAAITDHDHKIAYPMADWVSPTIVNTIRRCLQYDIKLRPSVDDLIDEYEKLLTKI